MKQRDKLRYILTEFGWTNGRFGPAFEDWKETVLERIHARGLCNDCFKGMYWCEKKKKHQGPHATADGLAWGQE